MSIQYDAKQAALKAYPQDRESGVELFLQILDVSSSDFEYEESRTPEQYIYGDTPKNTEE